jgi:arylsulfatase A-like enzyme
LRAATSGTIALFIGLNVFLQPWGSRFSLYFLPLCFLFVVVTALTAVLPHPAKRFHFLADAWVISILLLGTGVLHDLNRGPQFVRALALAAFWAGILTLSWFFHKHRTRQFWVLTVPGISALVMVTVSMFLVQTPRTTVLTGTTTPANVPNVILITLDTVRADHMSLYGYSRRNTPHLEEFAREATLYTHAVAPGDMTLSTHGSIFTGLYPTWHRAHYGQTISPLEPDFKTLAEILSQNGYITAAVVSNYAFLGHDFGLDQGFQYYDVREPVPFLTGVPASYTLRKPVRDWLERQVPHRIRDVRYRNAAQINDAVFSLLDDLHRQGTFFLFVNYMDAHWPYMPPEPFDRFYPGKDDTFSTDRFNTLRSEVVAEQRLPTPSERAHLISQYDGSIAYLDAQLKRLFDRLRQADLYDNSLIIITSDHGEAFGEKGMFEHGVSVDEHQVWVPLLIKYPRMREGQQERRTVSLVDLMPTVLDVLGFEDLAHVQGVSLRKQNLHETRHVMAESFPYEEYRNLYPRFRRVERALYSDPLKMIVSTNGKREIYDIVKDPAEQRNLIKAIQQSGELEAALHQWLSTAEKATRRTHKLDRDTLQRLRSLGYVQ